MHSSKLFRGITLVITVLAQAVYAYYVTPVSVAVVALLSVAMSILLLYSRFPVEPGSAAATGA